MIDSFYNLRQTSHTNMRPTMLSSQENLEDSSKLEHLYSEDDPCSRYACMDDEEIVHLARDNTTRAMDYLLNRFRPLVESKARAYYLMGADRDDIIQEGMIGLCKAIRDFKADRLCHFRPFAELCITRQIITAIKTATRHKHTPLNASISLHQSIGEENSDNLLIDLIPDKSYDYNTEAQGFENVSRNLIESVQGILSELEQVVLAYYLEGKTYVEIGNDLDCRTKSIDNALQRAKRKISVYLNQHAPIAQKGGPLEKQEKIS